MSIDVGRLVWARTQIQAAVDAAALAGAQSMPSQTEAAEVAEAYFDDNAGFINSVGEDVVFTVEFPADSNRGVAIRGEADIPTYFARLFGVDEWHVAAEGEAEAQVLDIAVVLDISGSMCTDSYPDLERPDSTPFYSPGRSAAIPTITSAIPSGGSGTITITLNDTSIFKSTSSSTNNLNFGYNSSTRYWQYDFDGGGAARAGMIRIWSTASSTWEYFRITAVGPSSSPSLASNQMRVTRAQLASPGGSSTAMTFHESGQQVWANRNGCDRAAPNGVNGPFLPFDDMVDDAKHFTTLFSVDYDKIGLASYSSQAYNNEPLTSSFATVRSEMDGLSPNGGTNIAHGLALGRQILDGAGKRANAVRVIVLLTDGVANTYCGNATYTPSAYNSTSCSGPNSNVSRAVTHARAEADRAANGDIIIFTIGLGYAVDGAFLEDIADRGDGAYYFAPTAEQLDEAFESIAEQTHIALVR